MNDTETLLEQWSPLCNMQAFVEANDSTVYFYLWVYPGTEMAAVSYTHLTLPTKRIV